MKNLLAICLTLLAGCATDYANKMNSISLGMNKAEVIAIMGEPNTTRATEGVEFLIYALREELGGAKMAACGGMGVMTLGVIYAADDSCLGSVDDYFVRLESGSVSAYGKVGDFDSTKTPESTININTNN